jgi:hypothetical protein
MTQAMVIIEKMTSNNPPKLHFQAPSPSPTFVPAAQHATSALTERLFQCAGNVFLNTTF